MSDGVPVDAAEIKQLLKEMNKFIPEPVLRLWLTKTGPYLRDRESIAPHEFLFLVANCRDRMEAVQSLPYNRVTVIPQANGTYPLDEVVGYPSHPDALLESLAAKGLALDKITFIGNTDLRVEVRSQSASSSDTEAPSLDHFRKEISHDSIKVQIRQTIENCQQRLNAAKLGGRLTFEERYSQNQLPVRSFAAQNKPAHHSFISSLTHSRLSFFAATPYSTYVPPQVLFPPKPRFQKSKCGKKLFQSPVLIQELKRSRPATAAKVNRTMDSGEIRLHNRTLDYMDMSVHSMKSELHTRPRLRPKTQNRYVKRKTKSLVVEEV